VPDASELDPIIYELIGRIIVQTALLEGRLIELAVRLDWQTDRSKSFEDSHGKYGGQHGDALARDVRALASRATGADLDRADFTAFMDRVAARQQERNVIAHDMLFSLPGLGFAGFRTVRKTQRPATSEVTAFVILTREHLEEDLRLVQDVAQEALDWVRKFPLPPSRDASDNGSGHTAPRA